MPAMEKRNWVQSLSRELFWDVHQETVSGSEHLAWLIERVLTCNVPQARFFDLAPHLRLPERERIFLDNYLETRCAAH